LNFSLPLGTFDTFIDERLTTLQNFLGHLSSCVDSFSIFIYEVNHPWEHFSRELQVMALFGGILALPPMLLAQLSMVHSL
jgi:hypothetical protein